MNITQIYARALLFCVCYKAEKNKKVIKRVDFWVSGTIASASEICIVAGKCRVSFVCLLYPFSHIVNRLAKPLLYH